MSIIEDMSLANDDDLIYSELGSLNETKRKYNFLDLYNVQNTEIDFISKRRCFEYGISTNNNCEEFLSIKVDPFSPNIPEVKCDIFNIPDLYIEPHGIEKSSLIPKDECDSDAKLLIKNLSLCNSYLNNNIQNSSLDLNNKMKFDNCYFKGNLESIPIVPSLITNIYRFRHEEALNSKSSFYESKYTARPNLFKGCTCLHDKIPCTNNKSFYYCILFHYQKNRNYLENYREENLLQYKDHIKYELPKYPVDPCDEISIRKFEENNHIGVNIFYVSNENKIDVLRTSQYGKSHQPDIEIINLLFHRSSARVARYYYIEYLKPIMKKYSKDSIKKSSRICMYCLKTFNKKKDYDNHINSFVNM